jgi:hypothetical protein
LNRDAAFNLLLRPSLFFSDLFDGSLEELFIFLLTHYYLISKSLSSLFRKQGHAEIRGQTFILDFVQPTKSKQKMAQGPLKRMAQGPLKKGGRKSPLDSQIQFFFLYCFVS